MMRAMATRLPATPQGPSTYHSADARASEDRRDDEKRPRHVALTKTEGNCSPSDRHTRHHCGAKPDRYHTHQRFHHGPGPRVPTGRGRRYVCSPIPVSTSARSTATEARKKTL